MAASSGRKKTTSSGRKNTAGYKRKTTSKNRARTNEDRLISNEVLLILILAVGILLFLCNFGIIGPVGDSISRVLFGIFGFMAYIAPVFVFLAVAFGISNQGNSRAVMKLTAAVILFFAVGMTIELFTGNLQNMTEYSLVSFYQFASENRNGGGVIAGTLAYGIYKLLDMTGTILVLIVIMIICFVMITGKSVVKTVSESSKKAYYTAKDDAVYRREQADIRRKEMQKRREIMQQRREEERSTRQAAESGKEAEKILRMNKKVSGVMLNTTLKENEPSENLRDDVHEITLNDIPQRPARIDDDVKEGYADAMDNIRIHTAPVNAVPDSIWTQNRESAVSGMEELSALENNITIHGAVEKETIPAAKMPEKPAAETKRQNVSRAGSLETASAAPSMEQKIQKKETENTVKKNQLMYQLPPVSLLRPGNGGKNGSSASQLKETAMHLQNTLKTFGVNVTVTDISQGPSVTRYELQPEPGVKVSRIVNLADDIKLNLAAADIRIEAPIPGKSAVGIEVPNKENSAVAFRDLIESKEYKNFQSNLAFAVGKDIGGQVVVSDIAKMPHMLIAGATGSGKSVCINTIIMSILYKAHPDDVKLIMVDPKVVELSVYNGIPHLMIPVVTDPKKAAAALNWGVAEMTDRYKKFADMNVRDLKGYNKQVEMMKAKGEGADLIKMPQIVIIVDELADLMMVAAHEVEESICRLAQLARAAGIHLIIATQRPSVDVITGLIKANMPSRVAFAVSSGVDSRTILDMNGAEKLLGKGDMLFYPQGYTKPARIQGAFISDEEVSDVVDYLKNQAIGNTYDPEIEEQIKNMGASSQSGANGSSGSELDSYFVDAGKFIIEKDKASIGMLQRVFKIGFNRAARIMDQLAEAGVVGEEEGTKPRKVLMSMEQFEQYIEEYI